MPVTEAFAKTAALVDGLKKKTKEDSVFTSCVFALTHIMKTHSEEEIRCAEDRLRIMFSMGDDSKTTEDLIKAAAEYRRLLEVYRKKKHQNNASIIINIEKQNKPK